MGDRMSQRDVLLPSLARFCFDSLVLVLPELNLLTWRRTAHLFRQGWPTRMVRLINSANDEESIPFSAFWLRSSVVSVLISLIADLGSIASHAI